MPTKNALLLCLGAGLAFAVFFLAPVLGLPGALVILLAMAFAPMQWSLIHESIHGHLAPSPRTNRLLGRLLAWTWGFSWDVMRFGHLMHHRLNRYAYDRPEQLRPGTSWLLAAVPYYGKLLGGHALFSAIATHALAFLPRTTLRLVPQAGGEAGRMKAAAWHYFLNPVRRRRIRVDAVMGALFLAGALWTWRAHPVLLLAMLVSRWAVLSLLDNMPHYGTALDGQFEGRNMKAPRLLRWLLLNQNFHGLHHRIPSLGWFELAGHFENSDERYSTGWGRALLSQFRGPTQLPTATQTKTPQRKPRGLSYRQNEPHFGHRGTTMRRKTPALG